ncbi:uncharacterized protein [Parasteatoda tepidariorum]|uniref:uncharacterized protein n=1 Tax=Parasteatoda tepidariorum TaxID=114398 RepID=UPI0039BC3C3E
MAKNALSNGIYKGEYERRKRQTGNTVKQVSDEKYNLNSALTWKLPFHFANKYNYIQESHGRKRAPKQFQKRKEKLDLEKTRIYDYNILKDASSEFPLRSLAQNIEQRRNKISKYANQASFYSNTLPNWYTTKNNLKKRDSPNPDIVDNKDFKTHIERKVEDEDRLLEQIRDLLINIDEKLSLSTASEIMSNTTGENDVGTKKFDQSVNENSFDTYLDETQNAFSNLDYKIPPTQYFESLTLTSISRSNTELTNRDDYSKTFHSSDMENKDQLEKERQTKQNLSRGAILPVINMTDNLHPPAKYFESAEIEKRDQPNKEGIKQNTSDDKIPFPITFTYKPNHFYSSDIEKRNYLKKEQETKSDQIRDRLTPFINTTDTSYLSTRHFDSSNIEKRDQFSKEERKHDKSDEVFKIRLNLNYFPDHSQNKTPLQTNETFKVIESKYKLRSHSKISINEDFLLNQKFGNLTLFFGQMRNKSRSQYFQDNSSAKIIILGILAIAFAIFITIGFRFKKEAASLSRRHNSLKCKNINKQFSERKDEDVKQIKDENGALMKDTKLEINLTDLMQNTNIEKAEPCREGYFTLSKRLTTDLPLPPMDRQRLLRSENFDRDCLSSTDSEAGDDLAEITMRFDRTRNQCNGQFSQGGRTHESLRMASELLEQCRKMKKFKMTSLPAGKEFFR